MLRNKSVSGIFEICNISPVAIFNAMRIAYSLLLELERLIKKITSQNIEKCWHTFDDWSFVINTVQLFCQCAWIWYPINSIEYHMVIFVVVWDFLFRNWRNRQFIFFFRNLHLLSIPTIYNLPYCPSKWRAYKLFSPRTPAKVRSNLKRGTCEYVALIVSVHPYSASNSLAMSYNILHWVSTLLKKCGDI